MHELFDVSQPQTVEYHHENRHLKRDAEGKEHAQHEAEIAVDVGGKVHRLGREPCNELENHAEDDEVAIGHTHSKHRHARNDNG